MFCHNCGFPSECQTTDSPLSYTRISTTVTRNFGYKRDDDPSRVRLVRDEHKKIK